MTGLRLGEHTVRVELLNNDRTPYSPAISSEVTFTIQKEAPREYIQQNYKVTIRDFTYEPASITVKVKDTVTFVNNGAFPRSATCFINGKEVFDTKIISPGQNATVTFTEIMECEYYATTHRLMTGRIKVVSNGVD
jgi:plastocyanin